MDWSSDTGELVRSSWIWSLFYFLKIFMYVLQESERPCEQGRGRERRREKIPSRLYRVSTELDAGLELTNL